VIVPSDWNVDFTNIDKWYKRRMLASFPAYTIYQVSLDDFKDEKGIIFDFDRK